MNKLKEVFSHNEAATRATYRKATGVTYVILHKFRRM